MVRMSYAFYLIGLLKLIKIVISIVVVILTVVGLSWLLTQIINGRSIDQTKDLQRLKLCLSNFYLGQYL